MSTEVVATAAAPSYPEGTPVPLSCTLAGGLRVSGSFTPSGVQSVSISQTTPGTTNGVVVNSSALPTGAATSANQATEITSLASLVTNTNSSSTGTKSNVAGSATSVTILAANANRLQAIVFNDSTQTLYLDLSGGTASTTSYSIQLAANAFYEMPATRYKGAITGIWVSANGFARITEFT